MRFSLMNSLLLVGLVGTSLGWIVEQRRCIRKIETIRLQAESDAQLLIRWCTAEQQAQTEVSWRSLAGLQSAEKREDAFEKQLEGRVFWMIDEAFDMEDGLDRIFGRDGFTSDKVRQKLSKLGNDDLLSKEGLRHQMEEFRDTGDPYDKQFFPHLLDAESEEYARFNTFLEKVLQ